MKAQEKLPVRLVTCDWCFVSVELKSAVATDNFYFHLNFIRYLHSSLEYLLICYLYFIAHFEEIRDVNCIRDSYSTSTLTNRLHFALASFPDHRFDRFVVVCCW